MTGRKRELIRWKQLGPAMRFNMARPLAAGPPFQPQEKKNAQNRRQPGGSQGREALVAPENQDREAHRIPQPAVAAARRSEDVISHPARRHPIVGAMHDAEVAPGDQTTHTSTFNIPPPQLHSVEEMIATSCPQNVSNGHRSFSRVPLS